ncbi:hypothetical protein ACFCWV_20760 [Streptomyces sp. NPDC056341]|uniref:hypothetical protein n=1 Tax=Streptomyces sp. NPDC056341 TaxID=3345788 RepID=UPI0035E1A3D3
MTQGPRNSLPLGRAARGSVTVRVLTDPPQGRDTVQDMATPERYRLTLTSGGAVVMQSEWPIRETAARKYTSWIGSYGSMPGARIALAEQTADGPWAEVKTWPDSAA